MSGTYQLMEMLQLLCETCGEGTIDGRESESIKNAATEETVVFPTLSYLGLTYK